MSRRLRSQARRAMKKLNSKLWIFPVRYSSSSSLINFVTKAPEIIVKTEKASSNKSVSTQVQKPNGRQELDNIEPEIENKSPKVENNLQIEKKPEPAEKKTEVANKSQQQEAKVAAETSNPARGETVDQNLKKKELSKKNSCGCAIF